MATRSYRIGLGAQNSKNPMATRSYRRIEVGVCRRIGIWVRRRIEVSAYEFNTSLGFRVWKKHMMNCRWGPVLDWGLDCVVGCQPQSFVIVFVLMLLSISVFFLGVSFFFQGYDTAATVGLSGLVCQGGNPMATQSCHGIPGKFAMRRCAQGSVAILVHPRESYGNSELP